MKSCLIIGGGLSGLSAAVHLSKKEYKLTVLESSPKFGGRAYSYFDDILQTTVDNGQHIIMGCYTETLQYVKEIQAEDQLEFQESLSLTTVSKNQNLFTLQAGSHAYPLNLLLALLNYPVLSFTQQLQAIRLILYSLFSPDSSLTVLEWLKAKGQSQKTISALWEFLSVGALNTSMEKADARMFAAILRRVFLGGNFSSTIILPKYSLHQSFVQPALNYLQKRGCELLTSSKVVSVQANDHGKGFTVSTAENAKQHYDKIICTVPPHALGKISGLQQHLSFDPGDFSYAPIVTVHCRVSRHQLKKPFYGLIDSAVNWIFVHGNILTTVSSDADALLALEEEKMIAVIFAELQTYLNIPQSAITEYRIIREKRATFIPDEKNLNLRPGAVTKHPDLVLAGDYTQTMLPATIESAILSGRMAAEAVS